MIMDDEYAANSERGYSYISLFEGLVPRKVVHGLVSDKE